MTSYARKLLSCAAALTLGITSAFAFESGSTGADGAFEPAVSTTVTVPESGVFNFTTVTIPSGVTVTFKRNSKNTPITILASGDVLINGTISVNGSDGSGIVPGQGGSGGFMGGYAGVNNMEGRRGEGPGPGTGGKPYTTNTYYGGGGGGGGFGAAGATGGSGSTGVSAAGGSAYGNASLLPLIGGSGGGGGGGNNSYKGGAGGGGGGAIVIASSGTITVNGTVTANGGKGGNSESSPGGGGGGGGSGGAVRLISTTLAGTGTVKATGGSGGSGGGGWAGPGGNGGAGRIRFEYSHTVQIPSTDPVFSQDYPSSVFPATTPSLKIAKINDVAVPSTAGGSYGAPDVTLPYNTPNTIAVLITGTAIPSGTTVSLTASPAIGAVTTASGALDSNLSVSIPITISKTSPSILTASVTYTATASNGGPLYIAGEKIDKIRVATTAGGDSTVTYITADGREIPADKITG